MKPIRLTMEAYGSYGKKTVVDFTTPNQNLFLVAGATGSGKTTIFDAVVFAIYGEVSGNDGRNSGTDLLSQYADPKAVPYVELVFSEGTGVDASGAVVPALYRVRRSPQYRKPGRKTPYGETVSLFLPDGSEYPEKLRETNKKIEEIVGLTRDQFLQVGMIAQGEFMRMLRVETEEKKVIFRKLFETDVFRTVIDELKSRQDAEKQVLDRVQISLRSTAGQVRIPVSLMNDESVNATGSADNGYGALADAVGRILASDLPSVTDLDALEEGLPKLTAALEAQVEKEEKASGSLEARRDQTLAAFKQAEVLEGQYRELEKAYGNYKVLKERRPAMEEKKTQQQRADDAWAIQTEWRSFNELHEDIRKDEQSLAGIRRDLPGLSRAAEDAMTAEKNAEGEKERAQEAFTKQKEKSRRAEGLFAEIRTAETNLKRLDAEGRSKMDARNQAKQAFDDFERQEEEWNQTVRDLSGVTAAKVQLEQQGKQIRELSDWKVALVQMNRELEQSRQAANQALNEYQSAHQAFAEKNAEYQARQNAYLDAQAGILAREKLMPGMPCPVCGSLEHPNPCRLPDEATISREELDALRDVVSELNDRRTRASENSARRKNDYEQRNMRWSEELRDFHEQVQTIGIEETSFTAIDERLGGMLQDVRNRYKMAEADERRMKYAQDALGTAGQKKEALRVALTNAEAVLQDVNNRYSAEEGAWQQLLNKREYASAEEAELAFSVAQRALSAASTKASMLKQQADAAAEEQSKAETMQRHYEETLPGKRTECKNRQRHYEAIRAQKGLEEAEWKQLIRENPRDVLENLRNEVQAYREDLAAAKAAYTAAQTAVGENQRPDLAVLEAAMLQARAEADGAGQRLENLRSDWKTDVRVAEEYGKLMVQRAEVSERYTRVMGLYNRLAGKVSGARMDLETFVQRYYLERVLFAANRRFREMSSGEFELRMKPLEAAGTGRNKGLDLLVYSTVTGKEREVGTLSGGESFMAALSLALGMADQIQEASAGIHLDMMFIDEGFGSLDDYSREQAVRVLQRMAGGSRLIGIISHVTELKQEIDDQLLVTRDDNGSHIRWQIS